MRLEQAIKILRQNLNDTQKIGWTEDEELLNYLDRAASFLTDRLITMRYSILLKEFTLTKAGPNTVPEDFVAFLGKVPIRIIGRRAIPYGKIDKELNAMIWRNANIADSAVGKLWESTGESTFQSIDDLTKTSDMTVAYWSRLDYPSTFAMDAELPYPPDQEQLVIEFARMFALNKNEYDLTQDINLNGQIQSAMASARGVAEVGGAGG